jgi:prepilin-type N-terminal cleavage/methylation domain-containing protein/prepilin-type processing-associated H-X9-DG protein
MMRKKMQDAFTLVELLVVIAIISVLASLLLPALDGALMQARIISCANNQRQLGTAMTIYLQDNDDWIFSIRSWGGQVLPSISDYYSGNPIEWSAAGKDYYMGLFPDQLRWCPSLVNAGEEDIAWRLSTSRNPNGQWGYQLPMLGDRMGVSYMYRRSRVAIPAGTTIPSSIFIRPTRTGMAHNASGKVTLAGNKHIDPSSTMPLVTDYHDKEVSSFGGPVIGARVSPHGGSGGGIAPVGSHLSEFASRGSNSLWGDGHVEWNNWNGSFEYQSVSRRWTNYNNIGEGWSLYWSAGAHAYGWVWMKPSRSIVDK